MQADDIALDFKSITWFLLHGETAQLVKGRVVVLSCKFARIINEDYVARNGMIENKFQFPKNRCVDFSFCGDAFRVVTIEPEETRFR
jgi:hypothetical protein